MCSGDLIRDCTPVLVHATMGFCSSPPNKQANIQSFDKSFVKRSRICNYGLNRVWWIKDFNISIKLTQNLIKDYNVASWSPSSPFSDAAFQNEKLFQSFHRPPIWSTATWVATRKFIIYVTSNKLFHLIELISTANEMRRKRKEIFNRCTNNN